MTKLETILRETELKALDAVFVPFRDGRGYAIVEREGVDHIYKKDADSQIYNYHMACPLGEKHQPREYHKQLPLQYAGEDD